MTKTFEFIVSAGPHTVSLKHPFPLCLKLRIPTESECLSCRQQSKVYTPLLWLFPAKFHFFQLSSSLHHTYRKTDTQTIERFGERSGPLPYSSSLNAVAFIYSFNPFALFRISCVPGSVCERSRWQSLPS